MTSTPSTFERTISVQDQEYSIFAELTVSRNCSSSPYEHFGFRGQMQDSEYEITVDSFAANDAQGNEVNDPALLRKIGSAIHALVEDSHDEIVEREYDNLV